MPGSGKASRIVLSQRRDGLRAETETARPRGQRKDAKTKSWTLPAPSEFTEGTATRQRSIGGEGALCQVLLSRV